MVAADQRRKTLSRLEKAITTAEALLDDPEAYARIDLEFHLLVADLAGNESIKTMVEVLFEILTPARTRYKEVLEPGELTGEHAEVHRTHAYFVTLIKRGDVDGAVKLWTKHLEEIERHFTARPLAKTVVEMIGL
jgi:DNA-binding FadR family transcriptional regulator